MKDILERLRRGELTVEEAQTLLRPHVMGVEQLACIDVNRRARTGIPEIVLAQGKTPGQVVSIVRALVEAGRRVLVSRLGPEVHGMVAAALGAGDARAGNGPAGAGGAEGPGGEDGYHPEARLGVYGPPVKANNGGTVGIITAGTSDICVAEEARITAEETGARVVTSYDVGVAGVHRLSGCLEKMEGEGVSVYIVAAGREGALPTLVAGLVDRPVIGLPVSVGYGFGGGGEAALKAMLQSCSPLLVVNIDAGVVAGACAAQIAGRMAGAGSAGE